MSLVPEFSTIKMVGKTPGPDISVLVAAAAAGNNIQALEDILLIPGRTEYCDSKVGNTEH